MKEIKKIFVVFKTHFDIGFTKLPSEIISDYSNLMVPQALKTCSATKENEESHRYVWTMSSWPLIKVLKDIKEKSKLEEAIRNRQIVWHGLPFTFFTEFCGLEELIRGMYISQKLTEDFGYKTVSAKMTDVPGHSWILPSLLSKAGIKFLHLGCNPCTMPAEVPPIFFWEGMDGERVLTIYSKGSYGTEIVPPESWNFPVWLALIQTGDNLGAHGREIIESILEEVETKSPGTEVHFGTLDDFYNAIKEYELDIPVIRKDVADSWIHGVGTLPEEVSIYRELDRLLPSLEAVNALERIRNGTEKDIRYLVGDIYEKLILFGEHTWGTDTKLELNTREFGGRIYEKEAFKKVKASGKYDRIIESWREKRSYIMEARELIEGLKNIVLKQFVKVDYPKCQEGKYLKIYNTTGSGTEGYVSLSIEDGYGYSIVDINTRDRYYLEEYNGSYRTKVKNVPVLGWRYFILEKLKGTHERCSIALENSSEISMDNGVLKLTIDKSSGRITSLLSKRDNREWIKKYNGTFFGGYDYDIYSKDEINKFLKDNAYDLEGWYLEDFGRPHYPRMEHKTFKTNLVKNISAENFNNYGLVKVHYEFLDESSKAYGNCEELIMEIKMFKDSEYIDFQYSLNNKAETPMLEAGHVIFPLNIDNPEFRINKTGTVIDPCSDITENSNHLLYCCEKWVDVSNKEGGMLFVPLDSPLLSIGKKGIENFDGSYIPQESVIYFNLFNNQWGTNFPQWIGGDFKYRFRLIPHCGAVNYAEAFKAANELIIPFNYTICNEVEGVGIETGLLLEEVKGIEITAFKLKEDKKGYILRIHEVSGFKRELVLKFNDLLSKVNSCDLLENVLRVEENLLVDSKVTLEVKPFEVITLCLSLIER